MPSLDPLVVPAHDVVAEQAEHVLQVLGLHLEVPPTRSRGDGDGDPVTVQVLHDLADPWQELDVRPALILEEVAPGEIVFEGDGNGGEEGKEVCGCVVLGCGHVRMVRVNQGCVDGGDSEETYVCP